VHYRIRQALTGESGFGGASAGCVARGTSALSLARGKSPRRNRTRRRLRSPSRCEGRSSGVCSYVVDRSRLQKSIGDHCWPHRSLFTGQWPGRSQDRREVNGGLVQGVEPSSPSRNRGRRRSRGRNRRRESRSGPWRLPHRKRLQARKGATFVHEGELLARSRHGGRSYLGWA
jgi:hypothetical protein